MERKIIFIDANDIKVTLEISVGIRDTDRKILNWEDFSVVPKDKKKRLSAICDMIGSYSQAIDEINPRTDNQRELIELLEEYNLNDMRLGTKAQTEYLKSNKYKEDFRELNSKESSLDPKYRYLFDLYAGVLKNPDMNDLVYRRLLLERNNLYLDRGYKYGSSWLCNVLPDNIEETINTLCDNIEREEKERRNFIIKELNEGKDGDKIKDFRMSQDDSYEQDKEHLGVVMEAMDLDKDHAMRFVALGKALGEYFMDMLYNFEEVDGGQCLYEYRGHRYYIGTEEELYDVAREVVENDPEMKYFWKQAVEAGSTEESFVDWRSSIVEVDGFEMILDHYNGRGHSVEVMRKWINICDQG